MSELEQYRKIVKGALETMDDMSFLDDVSDMEVIDDMLKDFDEYIEQTPGINFNCLEDLTAETETPLNLKEGQKDG